MNSKSKIRKSVNVLENLSGLIKRHAVSVIAAALLTNGTSIFSADSLNTPPIKGTDKNPVFILAASEKSTFDFKGDPGIIVVSGKAVKTDADNVYSDESQLVLKRKGYAKTSATIRFEFSGKSPAGKYALWTLFTLGGVANQSFTFSAGADEKSMKSLVAFDSSNGVSWVASWKIVPKFMTILPGDKILDVSVEGMSSDAKLINGFLLAPAEIISKDMLDEKGEIRIK